MSPCELHYAFLLGFRPYSLATSFSGSGKSINVLLGFRPYSLALSSLTWHPVRKMVQQLTDNADLELANERETREGLFNLFS